MSRRGAGNRETYRPCVLSGPRCSTDKAYSVCWGRRRRHRGSGLSSAADANLVHAVLVNTPDSVMGLKTTRARGSMRGLSSRATEGFLDV